MEPISVTALNQYVKQLLDQDQILGRAYVSGEVSNYKAYPSGHHYFSLKDAESSIRCVMFRREALSLRFRPENGMKVIVAGRVSVFPRDGAYQLYCSRMIPDGVGELAIAFEQLKSKLEKQGLFDPAHKKSIPPFPAVIALVTSPAGAAVKDMIRILGVRHPLSKVLVVPVRVQGEEAPPEIAAALDFVNAAELADLIITGRGGGSMEDLWAFNDERVARAIYRSRIPVISAVGHEPDITIADYVADRRASTPSNAAEIAVPDQDELRESLDHFFNRLSATMRNTIHSRREKLRNFEKNPYLQSPLRSIQEKRQLLDLTRQRLDRAMERSMGESRQKMGKLAASLDAMRPFKVLARGYAMALKEDGTVISSIGPVQPGDSLQLLLSDGTIYCVAERKERMV